MYLPQQPIVSVRLFGVNNVTCLRLVFAVLLPPVGVFLTVGFGLHFWLNILLTLLAYVPGLVHAVWIIATRSRPRYP